MGTRKRTGRRGAAHAMLLAILALASINCASDLKSPADAGSGTPVLMRFSTAPRTPASAPPAMKPLARSVPRLLRASETLASALDLATKCEIKPPMNSGVLICSGRYIPIAKASGGMS